MTIRHLSELGTGDLERMGLQPAHGRLNTQRCDEVQHEIAGTLRNSGAFRAAERLGDEGHDRSHGIARLVTTTLPAEVQEESLLDSDGEGDPSEAK